MSSDRHDDDRRMQAKVASLEGAHQRSFGGSLALLLLAFGGFVVWAMMFRIDEVTKSSAEVIARSRVQVIQSVDGGVLSELRVKEGDRVKPGQILARLNQIRVGASVGEVDARLYALNARALRLRAEASESQAPVFAASSAQPFSQTHSAEQALFRQRRLGLDADMAVLKEAVQLASKELALVDNLYRAGDAEDARADLAKVEDEMGQNTQVLTKRRQEQQDSVFVAQTGGIVKNVRVTTLGGVLRAGDEIMQIVPVDDDLVIEAKVKPADIARIRSGLEATVRLDPFDYTVFGSVRARVTYVSADTLKEDTRNGAETYYRVHLVPAELPVISSTGRPLKISPGMTAQIDIRTGDRSVMDYLLKPLRKTLAESFGER